MHELITARALLRCVKRCVQLVSVLGLTLVLLACSPRKPAGAEATWDPQGAAAYLDRRMRWWIGWQNASRDHGTFCVSCHTAVPYALARPRLQAILGESAPAVPERELLNNVRRRVQMWDETSPFYSDEYVAPGKTSESRGTEAVLSALMLACDDARAGRLSPDTVKALDHMWAEQLRSGDDAGAWPWLDFDLSPWESAAVDAQYYGAALAALAAAVAPQEYLGRPQIQDSLSLLRDYLTRHYPIQSLHNQLILLWASTRMPGLLDAQRGESLLSELLRTQNSDGGWSLSMLMAKSGGGKQRDLQSDGYATGLVSLVLLRTAMPGAEPGMRRGLSWLMRNQQGHGGSWVRGREGFWTARSLNKWRAPWSNVGRFMSDAATAYAVLALTESTGAQATVASDSP